MSKLPKQVFASETAYLLFNKTGWMQHTGGFTEETKHLVGLSGDRIQYNDAGLPDWTVKKKVYAKGYCEIWPNSDQPVGLNRGFNLTEYTGGTPFIIFHCKDEASKTHIISNVKKSTATGGMFNYTSGSVPLTNPYPANYVWTNGLDVICADIGNNRFGFLLGTALWDPQYVTHISIYICQKELVSPYIRKSEY